MVEKSKNFSQQKGKRAEREVCRILQPIVDKVYQEVELEPPQVERNLMQSLKGGHDIVGLDWIAIEIKHHETLQLSKWWEQTRKQAGGIKIPVLLYKKSRQGFRVIMNGRLPIGHEGEGGLERAVVDISLPAFLKYFEKRLKFELNKESTSSIK